MVYRYTAKADISANICLFSTIVSDDQFFCVANVLIFPRPINNLIFDIFQLSALDNQFLRLADVSILQCLIYRPIFDIFLTTNRSVCVSPRPIYFMAYFMAFYRYRTIVFSVWPMC